MSTKARTMSFDNEDQTQAQIILPNRMNRGSVNSLDGFYQSMVIEKEKEYNYEPINEKEYRKNFDNTFKINPINKESNNPLLRSRKASLEDDFQYNYIMKI